MSYWPDDIAVKDVRSPREILDEAAQELQTLNYRLEVSIAETALDDRVVLRFDILNRETEKSLSLFEVSQ